MLFKPPSSEKEDVRRQEVKSIVDNLVSKLSDRRDDACSEQQLLQPEDEHFDDADQQKPGATRRRSATVDLFDLNEPCCSDQSDDDPDDDDDSDYEDIDEVCDGCLGQLIF